MTKRNPSARQSDQKTTAIVAVATFVALSIVALVAWSLTHKATPAAATPVSEAGMVAPVETAAPTGDFERITPEELKAAIDKGEVMVLDVRSMEQFAAMHIVGAGQIPLARVEGEVPYLPKDKLIVTYCTCPNEETSGEATQILTRGGLRSKALLGGLEAWARAGFATATGVQ